MAVFFRCGNENAHGRNRTNYKIAVASLKFLFLLQAKSVNRNFQGSAYTSGTTSQKTPRSDPSSAVGVL